MVPTEPYDFIYTILFLKEDKHAPTYILVHRCIGGLNKPLG